LNAVAAPRQLTLFIVALQFLTRVPLPSLARFESAWLAQSLRYFPLVGSAVGLASVAVWWLASRVLPMPVAVGLMLGASLLLTGAFHEDGLADAFDGFGGGRTAERTLEIMHDSRIGAFGALALVIVLGLKWVTLSASAREWLPFAVVAAHTFSRWCALGLIWSLPYARTEGNSKAQPFAAGLTARAWIASALVASPIVLLLGWWTLNEFALRAALASLAGGIALALLLTWALRAYFRWRIGGYTGDCLGAVQQLSELTMLLTFLGAIRA
jgi:adenosylcobinamide-GDP ribazoletransferase